MDLKPLLQVCKGAGTTTALVAALHRLQRAALDRAADGVTAGNAHVPGFAYLLVATAARAEAVARQFNLARHFVLTLDQVTRYGSAQRSGVLLCDTDALWKLQGEIDWLAAEAAALIVKVRELTAWQATARHMAQIKAAEVRDLSATVGELHDERDRLRLDVQQMEADLERLRGGADLARQYLQQYRREWKCAEDLRRYGELQRQLAQAVGVEWPLDDGAGPPPLA